MDTLVGEEPLEIRVGRAGETRAPLAVTMRTPGDDLDLAIGFLFTEGLISEAEDVLTAQLCAGTDEPNTYNVVDVTLAPHVPPPETDPARNFYTTSSCGICGKASIDAVRTKSRFDLDTDESTVDAAVLAKLPDRLRAAQETFDRTGGLHAAGLFTTSGELVCVREDVGRHNAVDKVVGWALEVGPGAATRPGAPGQWPGQLRAGAEGVDGGRPRTGRGLRAEHARGRSRHGGWTYPRRLPTRRVDERLRRRAPRRRVIGRSGNSSIVDGGTPRVISSCNSSAIR